MSGEDTLDDYPLAVFCPYVSNPNDEQMARMIRVSREESEVPRRRYHPEDPERGARAAFSASNSESNAIASGRRRRSVVVRWTV